MKRKRYIPMYRHAFNGRSDFPKNWYYVEVPQDFAFQRPDLPVSKERFGVIEFGRDLTSEEVAVHELREV